MVPERLGEPHVGEGAGVLAREHFEGMLECLSRLYVVYTQLLAHTSEVAALFELEPGADAPGRASAGVGTVAGETAGVGLGLMVFGRATLLPACALAREGDRRKGC